MATEKAAEENTVKKGFVIFVSSESGFPLCSASGGADTPAKSPTAACCRATAAGVAPAPLGPLCPPSSPQDVSQHGTSSSMDTLLPSCMHTDRSKQPGSCCVSQLAGVPRSRHKIINF